MSGEFEEIKLGVKLAESLPQLEAPDSLWDDLELLLDKQADKQPLSIVKPARLKTVPGCLASPQLLQP